MTATITTQFQYSSSYLFKMPKQKGNKNWTQKEVEIVEDNVGFLPPVKIVEILAKHGFSRTEVAIKNYCTTRQISFTCEYDNLSLRKIANILGVSPSTTSAWHRSGKLPAKRDNKYQLMVKFDDVKKFLKSRVFKADFDRDGLNFFLGK